MEHHVSASCGGRNCYICGKPSTHKVGEEIMWDDPMPNRHNYTAYVCCDCFTMILGPAVPCEKKPLKIEVDVMIAPKIQKNSWLNDPQYEWFVSGYQYAATQSGAIPGLSKLTPEELYHITSAICRGAELLGVVERCPMCGAPPSEITH